MKKEIYTVVFNTKELEELLGQINLKSSLDESLDDYPEIDDTYNTGLAIFLNGNDLTYSEIYELFIFNGDSNSPYVNNLTYYPYKDFIMKVIKDNPN